MIVVDASVLTNALTDDGPVGETGRSELSRDAHWVAPEHLVVEVFSAIRGRWLSGKVTEQRAHDALLGLAGATIERIPVAPLLGRLWEMRNNVSGYDAAYMAVAEVLGCALVTADARLVKVPSIACEVRLALPNAQR